MANAMLDARQEGDSYRRIEVITGKRRRRRWTAEEKARIVAESFEPGVNISEVARRHGVVRGLLTVWRHKFAAAAGARASEFVPVRIAGETHSPAVGKADRFAGADRVLPNGASSAARSRGVIEIELSGARIRIEPGVDAPTLAAVLSALRGVR